MLNISKNSVKDRIKNDKFYSMRLLNTPKSGRIVAYWLIGIFLFMFILMFFPWQQNIYADGSVTALTPQDRPQTLESVIGGRIEHWHIREGQFVNKGEVIVDISDIKEKFFDPELISRLREQLQAKRNAIDAYTNKVNAIESQINALKNANSLSLSKAKNKVRQSKLKVEGDSMYWNAEKTNFEVAKAQFERQETLYKQGLKSLTDLENKRQKFQECQAKLINAENKYWTSKNDLTNSLIELNSINAEYRDKISKAISEKSSAQSNLADGQSEYAKLKNELANTEIRKKMYSVKAPQDGYMVLALKQGIGEMIKEGEAICTIMPAEPSMAVELYVKPMDVPLIAKGRKVRLEFAGWPALQFSGWPAVSVGTFGGEIDVIDFVNSKEGKYRILVHPDKSDEPWPKQIRMGSGVKGWAMLDEVPIWFELWRQLNGFPPSLKESPYEKAEKYYEQNYHKY